MGRLSALVIFASLGFFAPLSVLTYLAFSGLVAAGQVSTTNPAFDVASVKPSQHIVGPDYNNQLTYSPTGITCRNVTLQRLIAEAYQLQLNQVLGPGWLDKNEYDIDARSDRTRYQGATCPDATKPYCRAIQTDRAQRDARDARLRFGYRQGWPQNSRHRRWRKPRGVRWWTSFSWRFAPFRGSACRSTIHTGCKQSSRTGDSKCIPNVGAG